MQKRKGLLFVVVMIVGTLLFFSGCANMQTLGKNLGGGLAETQTMTGKTNRCNYKQVWGACMDALPDIYFSATSADYASGMIIAERRVIGSKDGKVSRLNIRIEKAGKEVLINVNHIPPAGLLIVGGNETMNLYVEALKKRIKGFQTNYSRQ